MNKVKELRIDSTLWATPARLVNLPDFGTLTMLFDDIDQQNKYHQVWKDIFKIINGGHGELKLHETIRLYYNDLPIKQVFKIHSITVVIKSLIEKNNKFYLESSINHCFYKL